jgi:DNA (cytosine-5)-methyltransferase 1
MPLNSIVLGVGAGGQALGIANAGFRNRLLLDSDPNALKARKQNFPGVRAEHGHLVAKQPLQTDMLAAGFPVWPRSQKLQPLKVEDPRTGIPALLKSVENAKPNAVTVFFGAEFMGVAFSEHRQRLEQAYKQLGYVSQLKMIDVRDFGVDHFGRHAILVALRQHVEYHFRWPFVSQTCPKMLGETLHDLMVADGWKGAAHWRSRANGLAPPVGSIPVRLGQSKSNERMRKAWATLGVDITMPAETAPAVDFVGRPGLTVPMIARLQGFPEGWSMASRLPKAYWRVADDLPPAVAEALARSVAAAILKSSSVPRHSAPSTAEWRRQAVMSLLP